MANNNQATSDDNLDFSLSSLVSRNVDAGTPFIADDTHFQNTELISNRKITASALDTNIDIGETPIDYRKELQDFSVEQEADNSQQVRINKAIEGRNVLEVVPGELSKDDLEDLEAQGIKVVVIDQRSLSKNQATGLNPRLNAPSLKEPQPVELISPLIPPTLAAFDQLTRKECFNPTTSCSFRTYPPGTGENYFVNDCQQLKGLRRNCCPTSLKGIPFKDMSSVEVAKKSRNDGVLPPMGRINNDTGDLEICPPSVYESVCEDSENKNSCVLQKCQEAQYRKLLDSYQVCKVSKNSESGNLPDCSQSCDNVDILTKTLGNNNIAKKLTMGEALKDTTYMLFYIIGFILFMIILVMFVGLLTKKSEGSISALF